MRHVCTEVVKSCSPWSSVVKCVSSRVMNQVGTIAVREGALEMEEGKKEREGGGRWTKDGEFSLSSYACLFCHFQVVSRSALGGQRSFLFATRRSDQLS